MEKSKLIKTSSNAKYFKCYLIYKNVIKEEAIKRYCDYINMDLETFNEDSVEVIEFKDEFEAFDVWGCV